MASWGGYEGRSEAHERLGQRRERRGRGGERVDAGDRGDGERGIWMVREIAFEALAEVYVGLLEDNQSAGVQESAQVGEGLAFSSWLVDGYPISVSFSSKISAR